MHQGGGRGGGEGGEHTKERAMIVLRPAMLGLQERRGQVGIWSSGVSMGDGWWLLWRSSSARRTLVAVAGRRFGGAAVVDRQAKSGELWPLAIE